MSEIKPYEQGCATNELRELIIEHPDYQILVMVSEDANIGDYNYTVCNSIRAYVGEYLACEQEIDDCRVYTDRSEFEEDLENWCAEHEFDCNNGCEDCSGCVITDEDLEAALAAKKSEYEQFWKPCILMYVNP